ncbi:glucoside xylosyltransferase 1 [Harmonia axyridis]|uniref:glucoside xylosyltransferase 1 n=1 Tax=Harmonia axyridis TaxID=115357 RepID=UPI001E2764D0|nr:glucoside xylosyltransferase 1 [Harmonia axyridis]
MRIKKSDQLKLKTFLKLFFLCLAVFILLFLYLIWNLSPITENIVTEPVVFKRHDVVVAVVACGDRFEETMTMLKSALMFTTIHINFLVVSDDKLIDRFKEKLGQWKTLTKNRFSYKVLPLTFPVDEAEEWKKLFKLCASQRLFLPELLKDVDSLLYMDTDTLFLTPVEDVWDHFYKMNSSQMAALAPEHEEPNVAWYNRFAKHPYYGKLGVNSGVMLMNLTKMRAFRWSEYVVPIYKKFKLKITWGDQDIINIIFHYHPGKLYIYPCRYNFRPDHCMYNSVCKSAEKKGVAVLHGSRGFFHSDKQPVFKAIYQAVEEFNLGTDSKQIFLQSVETYLEEKKNTNCGHVRDIFLKNLKNYIEE